MKRICSFKYVVYVVIYTRKNSSKNLLIFLLFLLILIYDFAILACKSSVNLKIIKNGKIRAKPVGKCLFHDTQTFLRSQWIVYILILLWCCVEDDCERSKLSGGQRKYRGRMTMERISCVETNQNCGAK